MKTINYDKFIDWLEDMEVMCNKAATKDAKKGKYMDAVADTVEAETYGFIKSLTLEEGIDMPPFVEVIDDGENAL